MDDRPYGGGPGMVLKPEPMLAAIRAAHARVPEGSPRIYLSAQGEVLSQKIVQDLAALPGPKRSFGGATRAPENDVRVRT